MASGHITAWQIEGEKVEEVPEFSFWTLKSLWTVTAALKSKERKAFSAGKL